MGSKSMAALRRLASRLSPGEISLDPAVRAAHAGDKWFAARIPEAVAFPERTESVVEMVRWAARHRFPVTARGAGFGYVGGCVPSEGGLVISFARMNRILEIHRGDFVAVVQPGVLTQGLQEAVERQGLFYPPDPASRADCSLGGNIATNAGGPRCLKYGVTRDYVLGLEVVLADGAVVRLGGRTHKNKTGFDLVGLMVGSEGLLGLVTEATLKLLPLPPYRGCLSVGFGSLKYAVRAIHALFERGFLPSALEIADAFTLDAARKRTGTRRLDGCRAHLIIEVDGQKRPVIQELGAIQKLLAPHRPLFVDRGLGARGCEAIWKLRREFSFSLRDTGLTKLNEDIVVPRGRLEELFHFAGSLQKKFGVPVACFGHAGDGNIHVNLMADMTRPGMASRCDQALDQLFRQVIAWGGVITGEHGIGLAKKPWWRLAVSSRVDLLHQEIKRAMDPQHLLNPGKFLDPL